MAVSRGDFRETTTIYQYKLIRKIPNSSLFYIASAGLLLILTVFDILWFEPYSLAYAVCFFGVWHMVYLWGAALLLHVRSDAGASRWSFRWSLPWFGYLPSDFYSVRSVLFCYSHLLVVGSLVACVLAPWVGGALFANLIGMHAWILLPRFAVLLWLMKGQARNGFIRINEKDIGYYVA